MAVSRQTTSVSTVPGAPRRVSFAKLSEPLPVPGLLDLQTESFEWFIGSEEWQQRAASRGTTNLEGGLESILKEISPIEDFSGSMSLLSLIHI